MTTKELVNKISDSASRYPDGIFTGKGRVYTCVNPYSYHILKENEGLYQSLDGIFVDGMTMCWWIRLLWGKRIPRLSFDMSGMAVDLFARLNDPASEETIWLIGARQKELDGTISRFRETYPNMRIVGSRNGYFSNPTERKQAIEDIVKADPTFTIVGMGSPLQERFVRDLRDAGYKGIAFTCGGFLHQTSERINYYPAWVDRFNLRAIYRLFHEKGLFGRLWEVLAGFPIRFIKDTLRGRFRCNQ